MYCHFLCNKDDDDDKCIIVSYHQPDFITFRVRNSRGEMYIDHGCLCVCVSLAAFPHYCTDPAVTLGNGSGCPAAVHCWVHLRSVHGFCCYGSTLMLSGQFSVKFTLALVLFSQLPIKFNKNLHRTRNASDCLYSLDYFVHLVAIKRHKLTNIHYTGYIQCVLEKQSKRKCTGRNCPRSRSDWPHLPDPRPWRRSMTSIFNTMRIMAMPYSQAKVQGQRQRSVGSEDRMNG